jgi:hypothetical protein
MYTSPQLGIGIEETVTPASEFRHPEFSLHGAGLKKTPDYVNIVRYRTCSGIVSFFQSGTGLTGRRTVRHSGITIDMYMDIDMGMLH